MEYRNDKELEKIIKDTISFIKNEDFSKYELDKKHILNERVFFIRKKYIGIEEKNVFEDHTDFVDIHYCEKGIERVFVSNKNVAKIIKEYDKENDATLFELLYFDKKIEYILREKDYLILYPGDLHIANIGEGENTKVIFKVAVK